MVSSPLNIERQTQVETVVYPCSDGEPVAESYLHFYALLVTLEVLKQYLDGQQATVLANQFLYYSQGFPRLRVAPDVMVIFGVEPGGRDSYKIWEEGETPSVIFEMTSQSTRSKDETFKKMLYAQLGVQEYWLFDPKGEWLTPQLQGYRLRGALNGDLRGDRNPDLDDYELIPDGHSDVLKLRLEADGQLISFYRDDSGEKLLIPTELASALAQERQRADRLEAKLRELGIDPNELF
ncbi:MAG: Uma2 family endonuclease [Leptolyngbyaceae bacterium]|nr:Uma2 family endonuclease [Leptolyngbyaceae bacterium]